MYLFTIAVMTSESGVRSLTRTTFKAFDEATMLRLLFDYLSYHGLSYLGHIVLKIEVCDEQDTTPCTLSSSV